MTTARILRIKAAQNQLIAVCGGIDDAVESLSGTFGRSTVGRWHDLGDPTLMPLQAVMTLEASCGQPIVTAALAELNGHRLAGREPGLVAAGEVMRHHTETVMRMLDAMRADAEAFADGKLTPREAGDVDRALGALENELSEYRLALAGVRAAGGVKLREVGK